jgi:SAM-dependent methyltransferase
MSTQGGPRKRTPIGTPIPGNAVHLSAGDKGRPTDTGKQITSAHDSLAQGRTPWARITTLLEKRRVAEGPLEAIDTELGNAVAELIKTEGRANAVLMMYKEWAATYDEYMAGHPEAIMILLKKTLAASFLGTRRKTMDVLELACGTCAPLADLVRIFRDPKKYGMPPLPPLRNVVANDISLDMLNIGRERMTKVVADWPSEKKPRLRVTSHDITGDTPHEQVGAPKPPPFKEATADFILVSQVLEAIPHNGMRGLIDHILWAGRPGGLVSFVGEFPPGEPTSSTLVSPLVVELFTTLSRDSWVYGMSNTGVFCTAIKALTDKLAYRGVLSQDVNADPHHPISMVNFEIQA